MVEDIIRIVDPSSLMELSNNYMSQITNLLPDVSVSLIGSLAVPMKGKSEIDLMLEVNDVEDIQNKLVDLGFSVGPIIKEEGFCRKKVVDVIIELHILPFGHNKISLYREIIASLRNDDDLRYDFELMKSNFDGKPLSDYKVAKNKFMIENKLV